MNTVTLEPPDAADAASKEVSRFRHWEPEITSIVPVVRWAILVRHDPLLTKNLPPLVKDAIDQAWGRWAEDYRAAVAERAQMPEEGLDLDRQETIRLRFDGKTPMIDLPKLQSRAGSVKLFDIRNCAALCLENYSSKIWTRVGPPYPSDRGWGVDDLSPVLKEYRALAKSSGEWFFEEFKRLTKEILADHPMTREGALEVTTVGLRVEGDAQNEDHFDSWLFRDGDPSLGPNLENEDLCRFMTEVAVLGHDIRELKSRESKAFWMFMPMAVELANGDLATRRALYLVRPVKDLVQVVGICLDDSRVGDFASEVALKVARVVANRI